MSTIKNYLEMSAVHNAMQNEKLWEQTLSIQKVIHNHWEASGLMALQQSIQLAMQPTLAAMAPLSLAINKSMAGIASINKLHLGLQQVHDLHKIMQPMVEYQSILQKFADSISLNPISESLNLSELDLEFSSNSTDISFDLLSDEEHTIVDEISLDNKLISYLKSKYHQFKELPSEKVALYFWNDYIRPILIGLIIANLAK